MKTKSIKWVTGIFSLLISFSLLSVRAEAAVMNDYCNVPPFVSQTVPPLVLLTTGRDHKLYYEAFNEAMDLDEDGRVDIGYMHNIDYYGYFDSYKCYTYDNSAALYSPASTTADKFCSTGQWSGNVLNWLTMSRMDVLRKVLYGGHRSTDSTTSTILERVYIPGDAHSWGKEIPGKLCVSGSTYKNTCYNNSDCDTGYSCVDKSLNLIGMAAADSSVCPATAVTWSSTTDGKIMVAQYTYQAGGASNGPTHADLLKSYYTDAGGNTVAPLSLIDMAAAGNPAGTSTKVDYITNFNDAAVDPANTQTSNTNLLAVTAFTTADNNSMTGIWQFAVDGDDGVEVEILPANKLPTNPANWIVATYFGAHGACFLPSATKSPNNTAFCNATQSSLNNGFFNTTVTGKIWSKKISTSNPKTVRTACTATVDTLSGTSGEGYCVNGGVSLLKNTKYFMIVRQSNGTGQGGVRVWYRKPLDGPTAWNIFGENSDLDLSSPTIAPGNECSIRFKAFVDKADTTTGENRQHLFCSTTRSVAGTPVLRLLKNRLERKWNWASKERPVCADVLRNIDDTADITLTVDSAKSDASKIWNYTIRNEVCKNTTPDNRPASKQDVSASGKEVNCRPYKSGSTTTYKPAGLLQKYGEGDGNKVCSRTYSKTCTTDSNCTNTPASGSNPAVYEGLCIDRAPMYFGLMTDSYVKNLSGGVLRKDIWSLADEINMATGQFIVPPSATAASFTATFPQGGIIPTFEALRTVGFTYGSNDYTDTSTSNNGGTCGWIVNSALPEGNCRMWGNPIGEMMYEGLRYLAGKTAPTAAFIDTAAQDGSLPIYRQDWGVVRGSNSFRPYGDNNSAYPIFPSCSKPFMLVLSDENVSYDSDSIPGSKFSTFTEDSGLPQLNINVETMADFIGGPVANGGEGIEGQTVFVGEVGSLNNFMCTSKTVTKLSLLRGLCPEEPTKQGSYYSAAVALYGKTKFKTNTGKPDVTTYSLVLSSPVPKMTIRVNEKDVTLVPVGKSTSGSGVETSCSNKCTLNIDAKGSLVITPTASGSFCPSNQIVDFYVDTMLYDNNNAPPYTASNPAPNITYAKFRINFEDVEQGADHDMDAISTYEICTGSTCSPGIGPGKIKVSVASDYSAGGINQVMGFVISGTTEDGPYLVVRDTDSSTSCSSNPGACDLPLDWNYTFNVSTTGATTSLLESPLWYAAKWGGFTDGNAPTDLTGYQPKPDLASEWDKDGDGVPDNYYLVVNPLKLELQLDKALTDILAKTSSGTAASIVNNSGEAGTNLIQAVFYPQKEFGEKKVSWIGELQNMWFYLDPYLNANAIREDTVSDKILDMQQDYKVTITFDASQGKTVANRFSNKGQFINQLDLDSLSPLWRAGELLYLRNLTSNQRTLKTSTNGTSLLDFADANKTTLKPYLQAANDTEAAKIIGWVQGVDTTTDTTIRSRSVSYKSNPVSPWRLGDIISSTPKVQANSPMQGYDIDYSDYSYKTFWSSNNYKSRGMVYVGANDGMLHAFKLGIITKVSDASNPTQVARVTPNTSPPLGQEEWAYIPKNALPYLKYLMQPDYSHLYTVDATSRLIDVSIKAPDHNADGTTATCTDTVYWNCNKLTTLDKNNASDAHKADLVYADTSWRTVLIGGMGLGGASRPSNGTCAVASDCVKAPIVTPTGYENLGLSSYFALDVSEPTNPSLMWEFSNSALGYTLTPPAIVRINGKKGGAGPDQNNPDKTKNGRWFAVFGSGPTGPINTTTHQFYGKSDQTLKLFITDFKTGALLRTIDTSIPKAFAGSLTSSSTLDTDFWDASSNGNYSHDAVYIGYSNFDTTNNRWDGGVLRLVTKENVDPSQWSWSKVIDGVGPITTAVASLQDRTRKNLWLYFGGGRYFYKDNVAGIDDADADPADSNARRYLYGIKEPCYPTGSGMTATNDIDSTCTAAITASSLTDQSDNNISTLPSSATGWKIKLSRSNSDYKQERLLTNPSASYNGNVTFTTFMPTADICGYGGQTFLWVVTGMAGGTPPASSLKGKLILQLSTGAFETVDLSTALTAREHRRTGLGNSSNDTPTQGYTGGTSKDTPPEQKPPKGVPRILQIREQ